MTFRKGSRNCQKIERFWGGQHTTLCTVFFQPSNPQNCKNKKSSEGNCASKTTWTIQKTKTQNFLEKQGITKKKILSKLIKKL